MSVCVRETGDGNVSGFKRPMEGQTPTTATKFPRRTVDQALVPCGSSAALPTPGYEHSHKPMSRIFHELMQPPHKGLVPSTCSKQVRTALEKIIYCYHVRVCVCVWVYTYIHTYIHTDIHTYTHTYIYIYVYIGGEYQGRKEAPPRRHS